LVVTQDQCATLALDLYLKYSIFIFVYKVKSNYSSIVKDIVITYRAITSTTIIIIIEVNALVNSMR
jgi:hypothetical protein